MPLSLTKTSRDEDKIPHQPINKLPIEQNPAPLPTQLLQYADERHVTDAAKKN